MRRIIAALLSTVMLFGMIPFSIATELSEDLSLAYEVDFRGTDGIFAPDGISGNYAGYTYTPSEDGSALTVTGNDYGSGTVGTVAASYWGGTFAGLTADSSSQYSVTYKIKNDSDQSNSQFGMGSWIMDGTHFWDVMATYNSTKTNVLSLMNGNADTVAASSSSKLAMRDDADRDGDGFMEMKVDYDGEGGAMTVYTKIGGDWTELVTRAITVNEDDEFGLAFYFYRTGTIAFTVKDMKVYASDGKFATDLSLVYTADFRGTDGYFAPNGISGNYAGYTYTPSADGKELTVTGKQYGSGTEGTVGASYWGGAISGLVTNDSSRYMVTYKVKNDSDQASSQFGVGSWITGTTTFWNVMSTYNSTQANVLSLMNGNTDAVGAVLVKRERMRDEGDLDADGYMDIRVDYDGAEGTMDFYTRIDGAWTNLVSRTIEAGDSDRFGIMLYLYRTGTINFSIKDYKVYSTEENVPRQDAFSDKSLAYEVDFRGTDGVFAPAGVSGNYAGYSYTPSLDGTALTITGTDYGSGEEGTTAATYWGGAISGLTADTGSQYSITYKVKNDSDQASSQFGVGGWITTSPKNWSVWATYNSTAASYLALMNGNSDPTYASTPNRTAMRDSTDKDGDGFMEMRLDYDGPGATMTAYAKIGGEWTELVSRAITVDDDDQFGLLFYLYRTGTINFTVKDVKIYANQGKFATDLRLAYEANFYGTDGYFAPTGVSGNYGGYTFTPSNSGRTLTVVGNDYYGGGEGTTAAAYWGGRIKGLETTASSRYMLTYKVRNDSTADGSQFGVGGWIMGTTKFWDVMATYNSTDTTTVLSLMNGNTDAVASDAEQKTLMRDVADTDEAGFMDIRIDYDGPESKMTVYTRVDGDWTKIGERTIEAGESNDFGVMFYVYRTAAVNFVIKDLNVYAEAGNEPSDLTLAYEFDFSGSDPVFTPGGVSGNSSGYAFTPSGDGRTLTVVGSDYAGEGDGMTGATFWGARVKGLTADSFSKYALVYKIKNNSEKANSQFGLGGWISDTTKFWNIWATYNSAAASMLSTVNGNSDIVAAAPAARTAMRDSSDKDANGFMEMKILYDGTNSTMTVYTKVGGDWAELVSRDITVNDSDRFGLMFYLYRTGSINFTIKDAKIYASGDKEPSAEEDYDEDDVTGYTWVKKEFTLAEVKPRYGMEKLLSANNMTAEAVFRNQMDGYWTKILYTDHPVLSYAKDFSATDRNYEEFYLTFTAAIHTTTDTQLQNNLSRIKLEYTMDGVTWIDSGVTFTAQATGDTLCRAIMVPYDRTPNGYNDKGFDKNGLDSEGFNNSGYRFSTVSESVPSYRFTSTKFTAANIRNIRLTPYYNATGKGYFRLLDMYVWGVTDEYTGVPSFGGDLNPTVKKTTAAGTTSYELYSTDFSTLDSWVTNSINYSAGTEVTYGGKSHSQASFPTVSKITKYDDKNPTLPVGFWLPTTDGLGTRLYSPDMTLDPSLYDAINVKFDYFTLSDHNDITPDMRVGYSTDNGATYTRISTAVPYSTGAPEVAISGATTYHVNFNIKPYLPAGKIITNILVIPYNYRTWAAVENYSLEIKDENGKVVEKIPQIDQTHRVNGSLIGSQGAFRILDFSITGTSSSASVAAVPAPVYKKNYDSKAIQLMIDTAAAAGETECVIPSINPRTGTNVWTIGKTILVPSNMTLYLDNCTFRFENFFLGHMIENSGAAKLNPTLANEQENIHIIGVGDAILQGGVFNGLSSALIRNSDQTTWKNIMLLIQNVNGFSVENLRVEESRFWSVCLFYCRNGSVEHMDYFNSRKVQPSYGVEIWEQDGIDIRNGCENVRVNDVTGRTGDDTVAFNAIRPLHYQVAGKSGDVQNVIVTNIASTLTRLRMNVRFTATNGWKIHDVVIDGVRDCNKDFRGKLSTATVMLGDDKKAYATISEMQAGDMYNIFLRNIEGNTTRTVYVANPNVRNSDWGYEAGTLSNSYADCVIATGSSQDGTSTKFTCSHSFTASPSGTMYYKGLNPSASLLTWHKCANCNAVSHDGEVQEYFIDTGAVSIDKDITYKSFATLTNDQAAHVTSMEFNLETADNNAEKTQRVTITDGAGVTTPAYWGGPIRKLTLSSDNYYELTYKVRNDSERTNSQFAIGGWMTDSTHFWDLMATYNSTRGSAVLSLMNGNADAVAGSPESKTAMRSSADRDEDGFTDIKIAYDAPNETMIAYTKIGGEWTELVRRSYTPQSGDLFGFMIYTYRTGSVNFTVKDVRVYTRAPEKDLTLTYICDFRGADGRFLPTCRSASSALYTYTPSESGRELTVVGNDYNAKATAEKSGSTYQFGYTGVTPQCMGDRITATLYWDNGEVLDRVTMSVADYLRMYLAYYPGEADELIGALASYGDAARVYSEYRADETPLTTTLGVSHETAEKPTAAMQKTQSASTMPSALAFLGTKLYYSNAPRIGIRVRVEEEQEGAYIEYRDADGRTQRVYPPVGASEWTIVADLPILALAQNYRFVLHDKNGAEVQTLVYGVPACAYGWWDQPSSEAYRELVKALYTCGVVGREYMNVASGSGDDDGIPGTSDPF